MLVLYVVKNGLHEALTHLDRNGDDKENIKTSHVMRWFISMFCGLICFSLQRSVICFSSGIKLQLQESSSVQLLIMLNVVLCIISSCAPERLISAKSRWIACIIPFSSLYTAGLKYRGSNPPKKQHQRILQAVKSCYKSRTKAL